MARAARRRGAVPAARRARRRRHADARRAGRPRSRRFSAREALPARLLVVLLQPTSPFRRAEHIDAAVDLLTSSGADSVVTVMPVPHQFTPVVPDAACRATGSSPWADGPAPTRRQDKPLAVRAQRPRRRGRAHDRSLDGARSLYGTDTRGLVMSREDSLDIDDAFDLELAELLHDALAAPGMKSAVSRGALSRTTATSSR